MGGLPEVVKDGITGYLVPPKNVNELADKMRILLNNSEIMNAMNNNINYLITSGEYSWDQISLKMQELYGSILSDR